MTAPEPETTPAKRRTWVGEWMRSEAFWRDVTSRALSGLIVLLVGAGLALAAGLIPWDPLWRYLVMLAFVAALGVAWIRLVKLVAGLVNPPLARLMARGSTPRRRLWWRALTLLIRLVWVYAGIFAFLFAVYFVGNWVGSWVGIHFSVLWLD
jgi:hypothetical protein